MGAVLLGVDYGEVRTGLARSDALGLYACGAGTITSYKTENTASLIAEKAKELGAELIVIGLPVNMNGTEGEKARNVRILGDMLKALTSLPVEYYDERLTTTQAHGILRASGIDTRKHKKFVDSLSAELILQGYMDSKR